MASLVLLPKALDDLEEIGRYIGQENPIRAVSFVREIEHFMENLSDFPLSHPLQPDLGNNIRMARYGKYQIYLQVADAYIFVVRIVHNARDITKIVTP